MSINAVKGVEIGAGFEVVSKKDRKSEMKWAAKVSSQIILEEFGGISNGQDILASLALKPTQVFVWGKYN